MLETGYVEHVTPKVAGSELAADVLAAATQITVLDAADFLEPEDGTTLIIGAETIVYTAVDDETGVITLFTPLANAYAEGDRVDLDSVEVIAGVRVGHETGDMYDATVDTSLIDRLGEKVYDVLLRKVVDLENPTGYEYIVKRIIGELPELDLTYANPTTVPVPPLTDGDPPAGPPTDLTIDTLVEQSLWSWTPPANADPLTFRVHVATTDAAAPSAATAFDAITGTRIAVATLPDGTKLDHGVTYYGAVEARDDDVASGDMGPVTAWVAFEVIGQIQSTHISENAVQTPHLAANSITGDKILAGQIKAALFESIMILTNEMWAGASATSGQRVGTTNRGIFGFDAAENQKISLPTDSDNFLFDGNLIAQTLAILFGAAFSGVSTVTKGGKLVLETAVKPVQTPPAALITCPTKTLSDDLIPTAKRGLFWDSTTSNWFYTFTLGSNGSTVTQIDTNGNHVASYPIKNGGGADIDASGGVVKIGSTWYVLAYDPSNEQWRVFRYATPLLVGGQNATGSWQYTDESNSDLPPLDRPRPALGTNGTDLLIARTNSSSEIKIRSYVPNTGASAGLNITSSTNPGRKDIAAVLQCDSGAEATAMGFGGERYVVALRSAANVLVFGSTGTQQADDLWPVYNAATLAGLGFNGVDFSHLSEGAGAGAAGHLVQYLTTNNWGSQSSRWEITTTLYDGVGTVHETGDSPATVITMKKRHRLKVSASALPVSPGADDPDRIRIYIGRGNAGTITDSARWRQVTTAVGVVTANIDAVTFTGTALTSKDADFPDSTPAEISTSDSTPIVRANGFPRLRLVKTANTSTANNTDVAIGWEDPAQVDTDGMWSSGSPNNFDPPYTGTYELSVTAVWAAHATGDRILQVEESSDGGSNWSVVPGLRDNRRAATVNHSSVNGLSIGVILSASKIYRVRRNQDSGAALDLISAQISLTLLGT